MKLDRVEFRLHAAWAVTAVVLLLVGWCWYGLSSWSDGQWLGGGSAPGLACGVLAGLIIVFEMLLWPRKALRRLRLGPTKHWMAAHIWLGLACLPLAVVHSGFHWGGWLPTILVTLLALAVVSGLYGLLLQNVLPTWMLQHLPAETIYSQIDHVSRQAADDARRMLIAACGPDRTPGRMERPSDPELDDPGGGSLPTAVVVGAVRDVGRVRGRTLRTGAMTAHRDDKSTLWNAYSELEPFLHRGRIAGGPVADPLRSQKWFALLRRSCHRDSDAVIAALEQQCEQRRQFDTQQRVHWWLHSWLPVHLSLSLALLILLFAHVWTALRYW